VGGAGGVLSSEVLGLDQGSSQEESRIKLGMGFATNLVSKGQSVSLSYPCKAWFKSLPLGWDSHL
jgi:hypothetical protein